MKNLLSIILIIASTSLSFGELQTRVAGDFLSIKVFGQKRGITQWKLLRIKDISAVECSPTQKSGAVVMYEVKVTLSSEGEAPSEKLIFKSLNKNEAEQIIQQTITLIEKVRS